MPTKRNGNGEQQPYIPAGSGDPSGEYANAEGNNRHAKVEDTPETSKEDKRAGLDALVGRLLKNKKEANEKDEQNRLFTHMPLDIWNKATDEQKKQLVEWGEQRIPNIADELQKSLAQRNKEDAEKEEARAEFASKVLGMSADEIKNAQKREEEANEKIKQDKIEAKERKEARKTEREKAYDEEQARKHDVFTSFENYMFSTFDRKGHDGKGNTFGRVNKSGDKVIVKIDSEPDIFSTPYGYGIRTDDKHAIYVKPWAVQPTNEGFEVYLDKKYFTPKETAKASNWANDWYKMGGDRNNWEYWQNLAKEQGDAKWGYYSTKAIVDPHEWLLRVTDPQEWQRRENMKLIDY